MFGWLRKLFLSPIIAGLANWQSLATFVSSVGIMSAIASAFDTVASHGWGAIIFAGIGITCAVVLVLSVGAFAYRAIKPLPLPPEPEGRAGSTKEKISEIIFPSSVENDIQQIGSRIENNEKGISELVNRIESLRKEIKLLNDRDGILNQIKISLMHAVEVEHVSIVHTLIEKLIRETPDIPKLSERTEFTKEMLNSEIVDFEKYATGVERSLYYTEYQQSLSLALREAEIGADHELPHMEVPFGLPPYDFRRWFIARAKMRKTSELLDRKNNELKEELFGFSLSKLNELRLNLRKK